MSLTRSAKSTYSAYSLASKSFPVNIPHFLPQQLRKRHLQKKSKQQHRPEQSKANAFKDWSTCKNSVFKQTGLRKIDVKHDPIPAADSLHCDILTQAWQPVNLKVPIKRYILGLFVCTLKQNSNQGGEKNNTRDKKMEIEHSTNHQQITIVLKVGWPFIVTFPPSLFGRCTVSKRDSANERRLCTCNQWDNETGHREAISRPPIGFESPTAGPGRNKLCANSFFTVKG